MINLSAIARKPVASKKTEYPVIDNPGAPALASTILKLTDEFEALDGSLTLHKAELVKTCKPEFFTRFAGRTDIPSSMAAVSPEGREVIVSLQNRYKTPPDTTFLGALMGDMAPRFLRESFTLALDSAKVPAACQQQVVDEIAAVLAKHGCSDALTAKSNICPSEDFHIARHHAFSAEINLLIEDLMPMVAAVKTKGRK